MVKYGGVGGGVGTDPNFVSTRPRISKTDMSREDRRSGLKPIVDNHNLINSFMSGLTSTCMKKF